MTNEFEKGLARVLRQALGLKRIEGSAIVEVIKYLDAEGVVREVDGKFPGVKERYTDKANEQMLKKAGWSKVERLVQG